MEVLVVYHPKQILALIEKPHSISEVHPGLQSNSMGEHYPYIISQRGDNEIYLWNGITGKEIDSTCHDNSKEDFGFKYKALEAKAKVLLSNPNAYALVGFGTTCIWDGCGNLLGASIRSDLEAWIAAERWIAAITHPFGSK